MGEGALLVLCVERADCGEVDAAVAEEHRGVVIEKQRRDRTDGEDGDADHARGFYAHVWLHHQWGER